MTKQIVVQPNMSSRTTIMWICIYICKTTPIIIISIITIIIIIAIIAIIIIIIIIIITI